MDAGRLLKWVIVVAVIAIAWKVVLPKMRAAKVGDGSVSSSSSSDGGCVAAAQRASEAWGSGLGRFVNPPYEMDDWSRFRADVESKISRAESMCNCADKSCTESRGAMSDLRSLVSDLDGAIRNGSAPPADAVQRQEAIDNRLNAASGRKF